MEKIAFFCKYQRKNATISSLPSSLKRVAFSDGFLYNTLYTKK